MNRPEPSVVVFSPLYDPYELYLGRRTLNVARRVGTGETVFYNPALYQSGDAPYMGKATLELRPDWRELIKEEK